MVDWESILNLIVAAIVGIGAYALFGWPDTAHPEITELLLVMIVIFLYAIFLQLGDIKRRMK